MTRVEEDLCPYDKYMLPVLINWEWHKFNSWNTYSAFFDNAYGVLTVNPKYIVELNEMFRKFEEKFGMDYTQAEIKVYLRITGMSWKKLMKSEPELYETAKFKSLSGNPANRKVDWLDIVRELRMIKIWIQTKIREISEDMDLEDGTPEE